MEWTLQDIADKKDSEGGWEGFLMWGGIGEDDVPMEIRARWVEVIHAWKDFEEATEMLDKLLPEPGAY